MARKKKVEEAPQGAPAWMATFSDLMNLLLCFFVLLFSMSSTDTAKYNEIVESITSAFSIFSGGGSALDQGILISSGVSQLNEMADYYSNLGAEKQSENNGNKGGEKGKEGDGKESEKDEEQTETLKKIKEELKRESENNYEKLSNAVEELKLNDVVKLNMDFSYNYIGLNIDGYFLFDSGSAELKRGAGEILDKAAKILKRFDGFEIVIEGHTDNVPQTDTSKYKNNLWLSGARAFNVLEYLTGNGKLDPAKLSATGKGEFNPIASNETPEGRQKNRRVEIKIYNKMSK